MQRSTGDRHFKGRGVSHSPIFCAVLSLFVFASPLTTNTAWAKTCSDTVITARGEPASYRWLARTKARGNWRSKVRMMPDLGDRFANWSRAEDAQEQCVTDDGKIVCKLTGRPCRKD